MLKCLKKKIYKRNEGLYAHIYENRLTWNNSIFKYRFYKLPPSPLYVLLLSNILLYF